MSPTYTPAEVSTHNTPTSLWIRINNEIYDVTEFQKTHPGGDKILNKFSGKDATKAFKKIHNEKILKTDLYSKLCVGRVEDGQGGEERVSGWRRILATVKLRA